MPKLSQAARAAVAKSSAEMADRLQIAQNGYADMQVQLNRAHARTNTLEEANKKLSGKVTDLRKRLLNAEVEIGRLGGVLQRVRETEARDALPTTETTQRVMHRGDVQDRRDDRWGGTFTGRGVMRAAENDEHWLDD